MDTRKTVPQPAGSVRGSLMRAIRQDRYGPPEQVFEPALVQRPQVGDGEVLVRVNATPISGTDWHLIRGLPYVARFVTGLLKPKLPVPGYEMSGTVEAIGRDVTTFRPGDEVYGWGNGTFAEYVSVPAGQLLPKPGRLSLDEAAAVPMAGFTALQAVRDKGQVGSGDRVLITGASGGVGIYAVQLAKWLGAEVTAVCSGAKMDLVRSIGADHVVDYTREDFADLEGGHDVLIDLYGNPSLRRCRRALKTQGTLVLVGGTGGRWFMGVDRWMRAILVAPFIGFKARPLIHQDRLDDLATLTELIETGDLSPILDRAFPLDQAAEAIHYVTEGRARGQVVLMP